MMEDIRLPESAFHFDGREYKLRCNFNVLADVVESCGGELPNVFDKRTQLKIAREFLTAMLNDYADDQGWPERYTARQVGRKLGGEVAAVLGPVMKLVVAALYARDDSEEREDGVDPKN